MIKKSTLTPSRLSLHKLHLKPGNKKDKNASNNRFFALTRHII